MSFRRFRRSQAGPQPVHVAGVSHPVSFSDAGASIPSLTWEVAPRPLVHRSLDDLVKTGRPFPWSGYGADQPHVSIRRSLRLPVTSAVVRVGRPPVRSPASQRRVDRSWRAFNALSVAQRVSFCVRRKQRKEVLFAFRIAGRRGLGRGGVRRTQESQYRCV